MQQLWEAFPYGTGPRFLIFDRDAKYGAEVPAAIRSMKIQCIRTSRESPWQNGVAERWVQSCRRDLLDHVIALNEAHLRRLVSIMSVTTTTTERILDSRRERLAAGFALHLWVASFPMNDSEGCIIVTSGLPDPIWLSRPSLYIHARRAHARVAVIENVRVPQDSRSHLDCLFRLSRQRLAAFSVPMRFWRGTGSISYQNWNTCQSAGQRVSILLFGNAEDGETRWTR